ncbi:MAG: hypothetical protein WBB67_02235 [bacterium]
MKTEIIDTNTNLAKIEGEYDLIIVRLLSPKYLYLVQFFEEQGVRTINSFRALSISSNKLLSIASMENAGMTVPKTVFVSREEVDLLKDFKFPAVLKPLYGRSYGVEIKNRLEEVKIVKEDGIYLQEYVRGNLIRIYKIGGFFKAFLDIEGHQETTVPDRIIELVSNCFERIGMEVGGIDCIKSGNKYYFIDINDMPAGIKHIENWLEIFYNSSILDIKSRKRNNIDMGLLGKSRKFRSFSDPNIIKIS